MLVWRSPDSIYHIHRLWLCYAVRQRASALCVSSVPSSKCRTNTRTHTRTQVEFILDEDGQHVVSEECRDLISRLLSGDPEQRLGHRGAGEVKLHPWFKVRGCCVCCLLCYYVRLDTS